MSQEAGSKLKFAVVCGALALATFLLFSRALDYGFINYDDPAFVANNPHVQRGLTAEGVRWAFAVDRDFWHPLTWLSLMVDRELWGDGARGHRAMNLAWHALNAVLVLVLLRRMTGRFGWAVWGAVIFAWHPQRVESVVWITERKDVLSGFFALVAIWAWLRLVEARRREEGRVWGWYCAALVAFACGLMSKSVLVALPLVLLLLDTWAPSSGSSGAAEVTARLPWWKRGVQLVPFLALSLVVGLFTVSTQQAGGSFTLSLTLDQRVANAVVSIVRYLGMFVWPRGLAVLYPHPGDWPVAVFGAAGLVVTAATLLAWWYRRERPAVFTGWGWFIAFLLPTLGLVQVGLQAMADRYSYLPSIGLVLALAGGLGPVLASRAARVRRGAAAIGAVVAGVLATCSWHQQAVWRDAGTLFTHAVAVTRDNYVAHTALALDCLDSGRLPEAVQHAERAIAIAPDAALALDTLAAVRAAQGRVDEAVANYRRVIALQPRSVSARCDLGRILLGEGKIDEAAALFSEASEIRPVNVPAHLGLADVAIVRQDFERALVHLGRALDLAPRDASTAMRVAAVQLRVGRRDQAAATLSFAAGLEPANVALQRDVGDLLGQLGRFDAAAAAYERAAQLAPSDAATHARLGFVYFLLKRPADAVRSWEQAKALDPGMTDLDARIRQARAQIAPTP